MSTLSITRSFYSSAIFFSGLCILTGLLQSIIYFELGYRMNELQSLGGWSLFGFLIWLIWSLILLKYYHHKQYGFTYWTMMAYIAASLYYIVLAYGISKTSEFTTHYIIVSLILMGMSILYAGSLIFSKAGKRPWLKAAGISLFILGLISFSTFTRAFSSYDILLNGTAAKIVQWVTLMGSLVPILFIMNFWSERATAEKAYTSRQKSLNTYMDLVAFIALGSTLFFGLKLGSESIWLSRNPDHVPEYLQKLAQPYEARTYTNSQGDTLQYRLLKPLDYDSTQQYPLVVCLHGSSGCGTDNAKQVAASLPAQLLSTHENRTKYPAFLFVPQCPPEMGWGGIHNLPAVDSLVFETIHALEEEFPLDTDRRYVAGNSLGGYGTWHLICTQPELFAAAIPISGGGNPALAQNIVDMPIWAFHGAEDRNVPVRGSRDIIEAIKKAGGNPRYTAYPDKAHNISKNVTDTPDLLDWLFAQQRE